MVQEVQQEILHIVQSQRNKFQIILYQLMNHLQKLYKPLKLLYQLVNNKLCGKSVSSLESPTIFDESLKLLQHQFLFLILIYSVVNQTILSLVLYRVILYCYYIKSMINCTSSSYVLRRHLLYSHIPWEKSKTVFCFFDN